MATWSSFEKDKLITEGFRDFFKKKKKPAGTYPASELTTIVNLISNLAKKLNIDVDTSKIVDEFEAVLKSKNYNLQEQEDKIMIGGDVKLDLTKAPTLKTFMDAVAAQNPQGLKILLKALKRGAFDVSEYQPAASTEQTPTEEPKQATSATPVVPEEEPEKETSSRIDFIKPPRSLRDVRGSENYKKFMASLLDFFANQMKIDIKIAKKIVRDIWAKTPVSGKFNKLVFKEQIEKEIDIAAILANSGLNPTQQIKVLGALKKWAAQNSDLIDNRMTQILRLRDKEEQKPQTARAQPEPEQTTPATVESKLPIVITMDEVINYITSSDKFLEDIKKLFDLLPDEKYKFKNIEEIKQLFSDFPSDIFDHYSNLLSHEESPTAKYIKLQKTTNEQVNIKTAFNTGNPKSDLLYYVFGLFLIEYIKIRSKKIPNLPEEAIKILNKSIIGLDKEHLNSILQNASRDDASIDDEEEAETDRIEPAPEPAPEPVSEPQATEEPEPEPEPASSASPDSDTEQDTEKKPLDVVKEMLKGKVTDEQLQAFINELKSLKEITIGDTTSALGITREEYDAIRARHDAVYKAIRGIRGDAGKEFLQALAKVVMEPAVQTAPEPTPAPEPEPEPADSKNTKSDPEDIQPPPKSKKKGPPPIKDPEAYEHGKKGKSMNPNGKLIDRTVQNIDKAINGLSKVKAGSDDEKLRNKIDSYIRGLDEYEPSTKLEESLMLRWKTIAGIK